MHRRDHHVGKADGHRHVEKRVPGEVGDVGGEAEALADHPQQDTRPRNADANEEATPLAG